MKKYAADVNEIKRLGGNGTTTPSDRSPEQTEMALFWVESSPLQWNRIARTATGQKDLNLWKSARLFALLNMAMADGYISSFDTKYLYNFWRPITAIRAADTDGNPATTRVDPGMDPVGRHPTHPRPRLGARRRRRHGRPGHEAAPRRQRPLRYLQPDAARGQHLR